MKDRLARCGIVLKNYEIPMTPRLVLFLSALVGVPALAQTPGSEPIRTYKLTTGYYQYSGGESQNGPAIDINLRQTSDGGNLWAAHYASWAHDVTQTRIGWDHTFPVDAIRLTPSLQLASGGAWNGSMSFETGDSWFLGAGFGRTNLRDSLSLNFDPNDMYSLSGGYRWNEVSSMAVLLIRDNRLNPDQQHLHLIYRAPLSDQHRLTVDVLLKSGLAEGEHIERTGLAMTYDWPSWFLRVAWDPKTNFTAQDMLRLVAGTRF
jgi:hypothetical protein